MVVVWKQHTSAARLGSPDWYKHAKTAYSSKQLQHCTLVRKHLTHEGNTDKRSRIRHGF